MCLERLAGAALAARALALARDGAALHAVAAANGGVRVVAQAAAHEAWAARLPVPVGFTNYTNHMVGAAPAFLYDVGDCHLGGNGAVQRVACGPALLTRTATSVFDGSRWVQLTARLVPFCSLSVIYQKF